eukprot:CAMPEP_0197626518 /NCGR_PEP_ID=MMETSP1338-20131121/5447_1 /TAXON_ID=43686 ORGANISM="Pelagodinium beii, Strain RCC1491" /NCGR_SAMPLE_ID=MMETSP1338 /ASSEMBLY_ACC=CAM_ASM_000754 /LENGTH=463 /DNA_ID=CAMNT_0043197059 /DNA_START=38 /DNA_END=1430 /DNA_ORIENTATION=-
MLIGDIDYREYFPEAMIVELQKAFSYYDVDGDGSIGPNELYHMFKKLGKTVSKQQLREVMAEVDTDGDGEVEFEELCLLEIKMSRTRPKASLLDYNNYLTQRVLAKLEEWFTLNDMLDEGSISTDAIMQIAEQQNVKASQEEIEEAIEDIDPEGKGAVNFDKFCAFWAVVIKARHLVNYREFLSTTEVDTYRSVFEKAATADGNLDLKAFDKALRQHGVVLKRNQLKGLFQDFDNDGSGGIDFEEFCVMMLRLRGLRRTRVISPETHSCAQLWHEEGFTIPELKRSGFGLRDFRKVGIPVGKLHREGEYSALELRQAGYAAHDLRRGGLGLVDLRSCGYSLADLRLAGFSATALAEANKSIHSCLSTGHLEMLPHIRPRTNTTQHEKRHNAFEVLPNGDVSKVVNPGSPPASGWRQMTPVIREQPIGSPGFSVTALCEMSPQVKGGHQFPEDRTASSWTSMVK